MKNIPHGPCRVLKQTELPKTCFFLILFVNLLIPTLDNDLPPQPPKTGPGPELSPPLSFASAVSACPETLHPSEDTCADDSSVSSFPQEHALSPFLRSSPHDQSVDEALA